KTSKNTNDEGNDEENLGLNVGREEGQDEEDDEDELYRDVNINLEGRVVQLDDVHTTQEFEDSHVTLTSVNPNGIDSIFETTSQMDVQTPTTVAPLTLSAPTHTPSTIATISTVPQAPTPPTTALSTLLQDQPNFGSLFGFDHRLKILEANFFEFVQTNQFAGADSSILGITKMKNPLLDQTGGPRDEEKERSESQQALQRRKLPGPLASLHNDTLTPELLAGPTYELMKGSCKSLMELEFFLKEVYKATTYQLDWINPEGQQYPHNLLKPLPLIPNSQGRRVILFDHFINNDLEYLRGGASSRKYTTSVTKTKATDYGHIKWIEDLVPCTMWIQEPNKDKRNRLMRIDELHKFSDGTLTDVRTALNDRLKGIRMKYLPQTIWRKSDKERAAAMIQAIDKQLKTRRIMRSLERFVGGRLYEGDFRMLQRTI
nr:hypothetical protein [Tanacetum cinerariifolium]